MLLEGCWRGGLGGSGCIPPGICGVLAALLARLSAVRGESENWGAVCADVGGDGGSKEGEGACDACIGDSGIAGGSKGT